MRTRFSRLADLRRLFEESVSSEAIAEPLASFDVMANVESVIAFLEQNRFDVVGVRENGRMVGYVDKQMCFQSSLSEYKEFEDDNTISNSLSLKETLDRLHDQARLFVRVFGEVSGIITRADTEKQVVRFWLFGLISALEIRMNVIIRHFYTGDSWVEGGVLSSKRVAAAKRIFEQRMEFGQETDLTSCLQLADKKDILRNHGDVKHFSGVSKTAFKTILGRVQKLRDSIAHSQQIIYGSWEEVHALVKCIESLIESMDAYLNT